MKMCRRSLLAGLLLIAAGEATQGATLAFDDLPRGVQAGEGYAAQGIHFSLTDAGVQEGLVNGDSGGWQLNGTSGPGFLGFNGLAPSTYAMSMTFGTGVTAFSMDASRAFGSSAGDTLTASGFLGATLVNSQTVSFGGINQWSTLSLSGNFDRVEWLGNGSGFHSYGVDNISFTAVPEPGALALLIGVGMVVGGIRTRRNRAG